MNLNPTPLKLIACLAAFILFLLVFSASIGGKPNWEYGVAAGLVGGAATYLLAGFFEKETGKQPWNNAEKTTLALLAGAAIILMLYLAFSPADAYHNPYTDLEGQLAEVSTRGYGTTAPIQVSLNKGDVITAAGLAGHINGMRAESLRLYCNSCGSNAPATISAEGTAITATSSVKLQAVVCGNVEKKIPPQFCIAFSNDGKAATDACIQKCELG